MMRESSRTIIGLLIAVGFAGGVAIGVADEGVQEKEFILYTGADLKMLEGEQAFPVAGISKYSVTVDRDGRVEEIPYGKVGRFWIDREMKLNSRSATISNLRSAKTHTPGQPTVVDWGSVPSAGLSSDQGPVDSVGGTYFEDLNPISRGVTSAVSSPSGRSSSKGRSILAGAQGDSSNDLHDTLEVTLELASADSIVAPYLVLVTDFRDPALPDQGSRKFLVHVLDGIGREPTTVRLLQGGFPSGFELDDFNIYLYSKGREVPTNLSDKQIALTRDEAFQYLILEYIVGHKGETLAPRPMWIHTPVGVKESIRTMATNPETDFILDGKGRVVELEIEGGAVLDSAIAEAFLAFRFYPALESGKPVASRYRLRPKELAR